MMREIDSYPMDDKLERTVAILARMEEETRKMQDLLENEILFYLHQIIENNKELNRKLDAALADEKQPIQSKESNSNLIRVNFK